MRSYSFNLGVMANLRSGPSIPAALSMPQMEITTNSKLRDGAGNCSAGES